MYVHPDTFAMHLETLQDHFEIVRLADWVERARTGRPLPARACAITFDDGWRDNYEHAYPALRAHGLPASIFVCSDLVGTGALFWPERLAHLLRVLSEPERADDRGRLPWLRELAPALYAPAPSIGADSIDRAVEAAKRRYSDTSLSRLLDDDLTHLGVAENGQVPALLDWDELGEMAASGLVDIGSHTRRHTRLSEEISAKVLYDEIVESKRLIEARTGAPVNLFCYPNGDAAPAAYDMVKTAYRGACSTRRGWHTPSDDPFMIRRVGVHQDIAYDPTSFLARISGWL